ncbi:60S ribosomal protein L24 isoform X1 [Meles meles]|uniref:60S ribosomal protein L24 isoform X1 n=1 Tax=Meles meles TaxID=9662 RepID=UPI001E699155|nr:60S ribosomal protein L24 isoform X1 [Meles meles]
MILSFSSPSFLLRGCRSYEGRAVQFQWVQDLPRTWQALCQDRREGERPRRSNAACALKRRDRSNSVFQFLNAKCESAFLSKRNPRQINWTVLYRRKHKKGQSEEIQKKRTRRAVKFQRAITGASLADIMAKRNQKPEVRKAQREQAIRAAKEAKKAKQASKKTAMAAAKAPTKAAPKQKIVKPVKVSAPRVGGKR